MSDLENSFNHDDVVYDYNSLSEALMGFSASNFFPFAFSPEDHPSAPSLSGRIGCEK